MDFGTALNKAQYIANKYCVPVRIYFSSGVYSVEECATRLEPSLQVATGIKETSIAPLLDTSIVRIITPQDAGVA